MDNATFDAVAVDTAARVDDRRESGDIDPAVILSVLEETTVTLSDDHVVCEADGCRKRPTRQCRPTDSVVLRIEQRNRRL